MGGVDDAVTSHHKSSLMWRDLINLSPDKQQCNLTWKCWCVRSVERSLDSAFCRHATVRTFQLVSLACFNLSTVICIACGIEVSICLLAIIFYSSSSDVFSCSCAPLWLCMHLQDVLLSAQLMKLEPFPPLNSKNNEDNVFKKLNWRLRMFMLNSYLQYSGDICTIKSKLYGNC